MKIFYVSTNEPDYLADCLFHGFYQLLGKDFTHNGRYDLMYKCFTTPEILSNTYGKGFTMWGNLPAYLNENEDIESKIRNRYFDYIVYGSRARCLDYYELVCAYYPKEKIIFIDGEDRTYISQPNGHIYFKRELQTEINGIYPISFAIPKEKLTKEFPQKIKKIADYIPKVTGSGYIYNTEEEYYKGYKESLYGLTHKKSGWDCMRHYEILANYCIPYFPDINNCPVTTMTNFPKELIKRSNELYETDCNEQYEILDRLFIYTTENLTTESLAKYVLDTVSKLNS